MTIELLVVQCPGCGTLFQKRLKDHCSACAEKEHAEFRALERTLMRNRRLTNEELAEESGIPLKKIRSWIRSGSLKLYDYPNLADACDLCSSPIRRGKLCLGCTTKIEDDIENTYRQERLMKERLRNAHTFISKT